MTDPTGFAERFQAVVASTGARPRLPGELLAQWAQFVEFCEEGYDDNLDEYDNDLTVRDLIERVLNAPALEGVPELRWMREQVAESDERFRALLGSEPLPFEVPRPWWRARLPRYGGAEMVDDARRRYGVRVELSEE
ncbi:hypothetical protein O7614_03170 [Micromonospora sp. WMMD961]|uniref:hypothetical protein n=1 Tax=Micromonospora sp. WMMD961 TaxID=3016100 RepID=UPI0024172CF6|nr:hypothetical protein [Micromonospora sp. WMMD961]MDG4778646.1 hypothetical protein [Micromonospora sp. WMMD961]